MGWRQMPFVIRPTLYVSEVVPDRAAQQRIHSIAQDAIVHLITVMQPVVVHGPGQVAHFLGGVALRGSEVDASHKVRTGAAADRCCLSTQSLRYVLDQCLAVAVEIAKQ